MSVMKIVINSGGVKREIRGSFRIFGSQEDLEILRNCLTRSISQGHFTAGWIDVPYESASPVNDWWQAVEAIKEKERE